MGGEIKSLVVCLIVAFFAVIIAATDIDLDEIKSRLPPELANANVSLDLNDAKTLFKDKCINVSGPVAGEAAYEEIEKGTTELVECVTGILNISAIQAEMEKAKPIGELDAVFNKYCLKQPDVLTCAIQFNEKLQNCFDEKERENNDIIIRVIKSLLSFVCHKGGDQIALFIAESGPECLQEKKESISNCLNKTFTDYMPKNGLTDIKSLPQFVMGPKQCKDIQELENCIVKELEECSEITPANIVESLFRFIKNETLCRTETAAQQKSPNSGSTVTPMTIALFAFILLIQKFN